MRLRKMTQVGLVALAALAGGLTPALAQYWPPQPQYYPAPPPPPAYGGYGAYAQPQYGDPYARPRSRRVANTCSTEVGSCQLPGPMFEGKGCKCFFGGYGKVQGIAVR